MLQKWMDKLRKKDILLNIIVILGILGMGCILFSSFLISETETKSSLEEPVSNTTEQYRNQVQEQLSEILSQISNVGTVKVLVTVDGSEQYHYATEGDSLVTGDQVKNSSSYVTIGSSSAEQALIESVTHPPITGVIVACEGGDRSTVQEAVYHTVAVACGISTAQIYVTKLDINVQ